MITIQEKLSVVRQSLDAAAMGRHEIGNLTVALSQLCDVVERLADNAPEMPDECREQRCTYFSHYLVYHDPALNGPKMEHPAYHHAEKMCEEAQKRVTDWLEAHQDDQMPLPEHLDRMATKWERRVCA